MTARKRGASDISTDFPSLEELIGLYQMSSNIMVVYDDNETERMSEINQVALNLQNGRIVLAIPDRDFLPALLTYDETTGSLSWSDRGEDYAVTIEGQVTVDESETIRIQLSTEEEHPGQLIEGWHTLEKYR